MRRLFLLLLCAVLFSSRVSFAEKGVSPSTPLTGTVTILSDGMAEAGSPAQTSLVDLARAIDKADSGIRVLTILGYGGAMNARDLMQLRGADFAVLNNDIFATLDITKDGDEARRKIRLVTPLFTRAVFLFAKPQFKTVADLKGRRISVVAGRSSRIATATTIFSLLKIPVEIEERDEKGFSAKKEQQPDAVLLFESDLPLLPLLSLDPGSFKLVSIPSTAAISKVYQTRSLKHEVFGDYAPGGDLETVEVTTALASFDWSEKQARYSDAIRFVDKLFAVLPELRNLGASSPWSNVDVRTPFPGWQRFRPAERRLAAIAPLQAVDDPMRLASVFAKTKPSPAEPLTIVVKPRPPLANPDAPDGGLIVDLVKETLKASGRETSLIWDAGFAANPKLGTTVNDADISLFHEGSPCGGVSDTPSCQAWAMSDPIMQIVVGAFARTDSALFANADAPDATLCVSGGTDRVQGQGTLIDWVRLRKPKMVTRATVIECVAAVDAKEADAFIATEAEGRFVIDKLMLSRSIAMSPVLTATVALTAGVVKARPGFPAVLAMLNEGFAKLKTNGRFGAIMTAHMQDLTGASLATAEK